MTKYLVALLLAFSMCLAVPAEAKSRSGTKSYKSSAGTGSKASSTRVKGHVTKQGKYVAPHRRSTPDKNTRNNWSTKGNTNPYTGKRGTRDAPAGR
jgi:hypothetical protein